MSGERIGELEEKLLPPQARTSGNRHSIPWSTEGDSFLRFPVTSSLQIMSHPAPTAFMGQPNSMRQPSDYLQTLLGQGSETEDSEQKRSLTMSESETGALVEAMATTCNFSNSSGVYVSSTEKLSARPLSSGDHSTVFGESSVASGLFGTTPVRNRLDNITAKAYSYDVTGTDVITAPLPTAGGENDSNFANDLAGIDPFDTGTIDIDRYIYDLEIKFLDLEKRVFEKQQSRKDKKARQRIINGNVEFLMKSDRLVKGVRTWVRREPQAAKSIQDENGEVPLQAFCVKREGDMWWYHVDLDSVYDGRFGPIYALARVNTQEKNKFELLVQVVFSTGEVSERIKSEPFLIRTLMKRPAENHDPDSPTTKGKQSRAHTSPSSLSRWRHAVEGPIHSEVEGDSTDSRSPFSGDFQRSPSSSKDASHLDELVVTHLEAQRAHIRLLTCNNLKTPKGDIAYHMKLANEDMWRNLAEGVVVGFFPNEEGDAMIEPLSNENASRAIMAGVISRSAYLEAHLPTDEQKGKTDVVCVIGMVKVQIIGSVRTGERVYTSTDHPGTGIPESHLPLGAFIVKNHTLLGMAMEPCKPRHHDEVNLVKCFVCIVLGINSHQLSSEVENILENTDMEIKVAIRRSNKQTSRRLILIVLGMLTLLGLLGFLLFELFSPGSLLRYRSCKRGCIPGSYLRCTYMSKSEEVELNGIQFRLHKLKEKIPPGMKKPLPLKDPHPHYYLNVDRCAYGGLTDGSKSPMGSTRPIRGPVFWASNGTCSLLYRYLYPNSTWIVYNEPEKQLNCTCSGVGMLLQQWNSAFLVLSLAVVLFNVLT